MEQSGMWLKININITSTIYKKNRKFTVNVNTINKYWNIERAISISFFFNCFKYPLLRLKWFNTTLNQSKFGPYLPNIWGPFLGKPLTFIYIYERSIEKRASLNIPTIPCFYDKTRKQINKQFRHRSGKLQEDEEVWQNIVNICRVGCRQL